MNYYSATLNFNKDKSSQVKQVRFNSPAQIGDQIMVEGNNFKIFNLIHIDDGLSKIDCDCMDVVK